MKKKQYQAGLSDFSFYSSSPFTHFPDTVLGTYKSKRKAEAVIEDTLDSLDGLLSCTIHIKRVR